MYHQTEVLVRIFEARRVAGMGVIMQVEDQVYGSMVEVGIGRI